MKQGLGLLAVIVLMASSCGTDSNSKGQDTVSRYADGRCRETFVDAFNETSRALNQVSTTAREVLADNATELDAREFRSALTNASSHCQAFFGIHSNVSCNAVANGVSRDVSSAELKPQCDKVAEALKGTLKVQRSRPADSTPTAPVLEPAPAEQLPSERPSSADQYGNCTDAFKKDAANLDEKSRILVQALQAKESDLIISQKVKETFEACERLEKGYADTACDLDASSSQKVMASNIYPSFCDIVRDYMEAL